MSDEQKAELARIYPGAQVTTVSETLPSNTHEAVARFDEIATSANVVEAVLPINLLEAVMKFSDFGKRGGVIIRAITKRNLQPDGQTTFDFEHYERVLKVDVVTERL
jgi:hypothetical protein